VRLEPGEAACLPLSAALVDLDGAEVARTPEWRGRCPGTVSFHTGHGHLLVAPDAPTPGLDGLMDRLLAELEAAARATGGEDAERAAVLAAGLALVAGRPPGAAAAGTAEDVVRLAAGAIPARAPGLAVQVVGPLPAAVAPAPAAIALAMVQLAVNAWQHDDARRVLLRVEAGPTFVVEWPAGRTGPAAVRSHRHPLRRSGWGWGFVRLVADALGGSALPPAPAGPGLVGACLGLGSTRLALPLACVRDGRVERATEAWEQDPRMPALGRAAGGLLGALVAEAATHPGRIAYRDLYRARTARGRTWAALAPESGSSRVQDLLRGLRHERALLRAPEPHATRLLGLTTLLQVAMGEPWPSAPPSVYEEALAASCARLGVAAPPEPLESLCPPDPWAVAYLLAEVGGHLVREGEAVYLVAPPAAMSDGAAGPLMRALGARGDGRLRVNA
jgi:hypothetical protein